MEPVTYLEFQKAQYKRLASEAFVQTCAFLCPAASTSRRESFGVDIPSQMRTKEETEVENEGDLPLELGLVKSSASLIPFSCALARCGLHSQALKFSRFDISSQPRHD
jgi:shikimate kinase